MNLTLAVILFVIAVALQARTLPAQNVLMIFVSLVVCEGLNQLAANRSPWNLPVCLWWPADIVVTRVAVRAILRQTMRTRYGIWLFAITCVLVTAQQFLLEPAFTLVRAVTTPMWLALLGPWFISKLSQKPHHQA